jgi:hypothetical protein
MLLRVHNYQATPKVMCGHVAVRLSIENRAQCETRIRTPRTYHFNGVILASLICKQTNNEIFTFLNKASLFPQTLAMLRISLIFYTHTHVLS